MTGIHKQNLDLIFSFIFSFFPDDREHFCTFDQPCDVTFSLSSDVTTAAWQLHRNGDSVPLGGSASDRSGTGESLQLKNERYSKTDGTL